jgi:hypothetical protein
LPITDRGHERRRAERADALNFAETLTQLIAAVEFADPPIVGYDPSIELVQLVLARQGEFRPNR